MYNQTMLKKVFCEDCVKNTVRIAIIAGIAIASYGIISAVRTYSNSISPSQYKTFSVQGEGKVETKPDIAKFLISVVTEGGTTALADTQSKNAEKTNAVISFVKEEGVTEADIKTSNYSIEPKYDYPKCVYTSVDTICPSQRLVGYIVRNTVEVKVRDFSKISDLMSGVVAKGANNLSGPSFDIDEPENVKAQARDLAIQKAKEKAETIAKAAGIRIGKIIAVNEDSNGYYPYQSAKMDSAYVGRGASPVIEAGSQEVTALMTLTFEIK